MHAAALSKASVNTQQSTSGDQLPSLIFANSQFSKKVITMKLYLLALVAAVTFSAYVEAHPQRAGAQTLIYYPRTTPPPRPIFARVARDVGVGGSLASNPRGGADARLDIAKAIGNPNHNLIVGAFAAGNTD